MGIYTNTDFARRVTLRHGVSRAPIDLTGFAMAMTVKARRTDASPALVLTTENGGIVVTDVEGGVFEIRMTAAQTATLSPGEYAFDVVRTDAGQRARLFGGRMVVKAGVS